MTVHDESLWSKHLVQLLQSHNWVSQIWKDSATIPLHMQYCMTTNCVFQPSSSLLNAGTTSYETRFNEKLQ